MDTQAATADRRVLTNNDARIDAALLNLAADGVPLTHDAVAAVSGISRRTVYRRFADQPALRARLWDLLSPPGGMPRDLSALLERELRETFEKFDTNRAAMAVATASAEGRQMRMERKDERVAAYSRAFAGHTGSLPDKARRQANGVLQLLCSGLAWREMRDQWDLDGTETAEASVWALRILLAHLARGDAPGVD
ncbi:hypothetical protein [Croceicoccus bisphenolivorans]|uniref:hypothetical protein n=1 Tax=Croceicoccus bisphenolivorans TaxID=1783232 RepID=UPI000832F46E|nr:hypothetical protein [Croceicoccus bisphenolivorans]